MVYKHSILSLVSDLTMLKLASNCLDDILYCRQFAAALVFEINVQNSPATFYSKTPRSSAKAQTNIF